MKKLILLLLISISAKIYAGTLTTNTSSLPNFGNCVVNWASSAQRIIINGSNLTNEIIIKPSIGFEISLNARNQFSSTPITLNANNGTLSASTIFIRFAPTTMGATSGNISIESIESNTLVVNLSGVGTAIAIPNSGNAYYSVSNNLNGAALKTALYNKIQGHTSISYGGLYSNFPASDTYYDGKIWDIYSTSIEGPYANYSYTHGTGNCGNYLKEGDCYNREHSFPQSWFSSSSPMQSDMFHLYPTDGKVNGIRDNDPFGEVSISSTAGTPTQIGAKSGNNSFGFAGSFTGTVFEPIDEYKGDLARTYFYMATRYENLIASWATNGNAGDVLAGNNFPAYDPWVIALLMKWHNQDPVSMKEINRNNAIFNVQNNRNPYIDSPQFAQKVWGATNPNKPNIASSNMAITFTNNTSLHFNLKWKSGNGNRRILLVKQGSSFDTKPIDGIEYLANTNFGQGTSLGNGVFAVLNGMGSQVNISNLQEGVTYYYALYEYNGFAQTTQYFTTEFASGSFSTNPPFKISPITAQLKGVYLATINWETIKEINTDNFVIERSLDSINWVARGDVKAANNSNTPQKYTFTDSLYDISATWAKIYYRVTLIDQNIEFTYSNIVALNIDRRNIPNLLSFTANLNGSKACNLKWQTSSEMNNAGFFIERSTDSSKWITRAFITGAINSDTFTNYNYLDAIDDISLIKTPIYYQLKQKDLEGSLIKSNWVKVDIDRTNLANLQDMSFKWHIVQNPINNELRIYINSQEQNKYQISIKNALGHDVYNHTKQVNEGEQTLLIDQLEYLPAGIYIVQLQCKQAVGFQRIAKY